MNTHYYFAYGSNCDFDQMIKRCPSAKVFKEVYEYKDMELCFPHLSKKRNCGVASIKSSPGNSVFGVLYEISSDDMIELDILENMGNGYSRRRVKTPNYNFWYYYSLKHSRNENFLPSTSYLGQIIYGAKLRKFPPSYITLLESIRTI